MTVQNKTKDAKNEYITMIKQKIDDLDFKVETLKMKLAIVPESIQTYYLEQINVLRQKKQKLDDTIRESENTHENVWENARKGIEMVWEELKGGMDSIIDKFQNEVPDKNEFIYRIEKHLAEINLNITDHEKKFKNELGGITNSLGINHEKQVEQYVRIRESILKQIVDLKNSNSKLELEIRENIAGSMNELKQCWVEIKTKF